MKRLNASAGTSESRRLGRAIKELRMQVPLNQEQLAERLVLGQANVSRYERGLQWVESPERLRDLAHAVQVPVWALFLCAALPDKERSGVRSIVSLVDQFRRLADEDKERILECLLKLLQP